jgi:GTPase
VTLTKEQRKLVDQRRKGLVVLAQPVPPTRSFAAQLVIAKGHPVTMIMGRYRTTAHILHNNRPVVLSSATSLATSSSSRSETLTVLRPGERALVTFQLTHPEYIRKGMRIILRDGLVQGVGVVMTATRAS